MDASRIFSSRLTVALALAIALPVHAEVLLKDGFDSRDLNAKTGAAHWTDKASVSVANFPQGTSNYAAKFTYTASNPWSELRFDLGKLSTEVWVQFDLYIPANYVHATINANSSAGTNNKFIQLWGANYSEYSQAGICTWANTGGVDPSYAQAEWNFNGTGLGANGQAAKSFIAAADKGKWVTYRIYVKAATASTKGTFRTWKNGSLVIDNTNVLNGYSASAPNAYRYGYLMGWANSGFKQTTEFYIDNVVIGTTQADVDNAAAAAGQQPAPVPAPATPTGVDVS
jgi:hypothetical protein